MAKAAKKASKKKSAKKSAKRAKSSTKKRATRTSKKKLARKAGSRPAKKVSKKKVYKRKVARKPSRVIARAMVTEAVLEATGIRGSASADSLKPVTQSLIDGAKDFFGATPRFWGRYFKKPGNTSPQQYHASESPVLQANGIRLLAVGRQTTSVGGTEARGTQDGTDNADAVREAFPSLSGDAMVFLDVEQSHPLSRTYYRGWAKALVANGASHGVNFIPCVYGSFSATPTWKALRDEVANGIPCGGVWIARYLVSDGCAAMKDWSDSHVTPAGLPSSVPVLAWQYAQNCHSIDLNQCNPNHEADFLARLIAP